RVVRTSTLYSRRVSCDRLAHTEQKRNTFRDRIPMVLHDNLFRAIPYDQPVIPSARRDGADSSLLRLPRGSLRCDAVALARMVRCLLASSRRDGQCASGGPGATARLAAQDRCGFAT